MFRPALRSRPNAWVLAPVYTDGGFNAPGRMAFDSQGRVWSNNNFETPGSSPGRGLAVLSPAGRALSGPNGFTAGNLDEPQGLAIDARDNVWIPNQGATHVTRYPNGNPRAAQQITGGGINSSFDIALDADRSGWVTNGSVSPDPAANSSVTKILSDGTVDPVSPITGGGILSPMGIAVDSAGNKWVANLASSSVTVIGPNGGVRPPSPIRTGSIRGGWGVAVDGSDNVWVASFLNPRLTQLCGRRRSSCPPGTTTGQPISPPTTGFTNRGLQHLTAVQLDQSGNVWVANNWSTSSPPQRFVGGNGLVEFIGLATPVVTPLIGLPRRPS